MKIFLLPNNSLSGKLLLLALSGAISLIVFECVLRAQQYYTGMKIKNNGTVAGVSTIADTLVMQKILDYREVYVPGAAKAYMWQNKLHVFNEYNMRQSTPFLPKNNKVFRIAIFGDSLTYGQGIDNNDTYSSIIEKELNKSYRVEVLNLGVMGYESRDILKLIERFIPELDPDLVIYGVCLNDFLPLNTGQYDNNLAYKIPLPEEWKAFISKHTLTGKFFGDKYNKILIYGGLRNNFTTDILKNFNNYQSRFKKDVSEMNKFVLYHNAPPILAMVLNQGPSTTDENSKITRIAESYLRSAGMNVISAFDYYKKYDGEVWRVSEWEGHPNEKAHAVYAEYFITYIKSLSQLETYKK